MEQIVTEVVGQIITPAHGILHGGSVFIVGGMSEVT
jgi:hypothetical protein